jgi:hypothetical protein
MDSAFRVPGTDFRFGLDPILGLVPGLGDVVGGGFAVYLIWLAVRAGAPAAVLTRMGFNVAIDTLFGAIPLLGDLLDAGWKGNLRNLAILEGYIEDPGRVRSRSYVVLLLVAAMLVVVMIGTLWLAFAAAGYLWDLVF